DLADRIRTRLRAAGHIAGPELAGPGWGNGERRYAAGDRLLVHGTLRTGGQRLHNGSVVTITAVAVDGVAAVDQHGTAVRLPAEFIAGHRTDGSPNCSHAWARTVDGVQGGTWPQVHLLGTAALERFTGYTAQSRGRHATHTWNVSRLPDIDYGGVLADQRTPETEVLDAMRREPDTGFAIHDAPSRIEESQGPISIPRSGPGSGGRATSATRSSHWCAGSSVRWDRCVGRSGARSRAGGVRACNSPSTVRRRASGQPYSASHSMRRRSLGCRSCRSSRHR